MLGYCDAYALCIDPYRGRGLDLHPFFISPVEWAELWFSPCAIFAPSGKPHGTYRIGSLYQEHNHSHQDLPVSDNGFIKMQKKCNWGTDTNVLIPLNTA
jgi:hypothetical protein